MGQACSFCLDINSIDFMHAGLCVYRGVARVGPQTSTLHRGEVVVTRALCSQYPQRQGPMPPLHALAGNPPRPSPPGYPGPPYGYGMGGGPPPQLRHLLNQGPLNQKGQGPSMAALSHMARLGPPAMTGGAYAMQKVAPGGHPMHSPLQPGIRHPQQHVSLSLWASRTLRPGQKRLHLRLDEGINLGGK